MGKPSNMRKTTVTITCDICLKEVDASDYGSLFFMMMHITGKEMKRLPTEENFCKEHLDEIREFVVKLKTNEK